MDTISRKRRSENMRRIQAKNTTPELIVRRLVYTRGHRYRLHSKKLPGKPDLVFPRLRKVIFIHGCFWHQHQGCIDGRMPKSRQEYWEPKFRGNVNRDRLYRRQLRKAGWKVLVVWECETRDLERVEKRIIGYLERING